MILLKKINQDSTFEFKKILKKGYKINEQPDVINVKKFVNGNRKKIVSTYTDTVIKIDLGCFDGDTLATYLSNLTDGKYQYYSFSDKVLKQANFIVTVPEQCLDNCTRDVIVEDFTVTLEKSSDVE